MYPYQMTNIPIKYEGSEILKLSVNFHIDRYAAGKFSSYDRYRGRYNDLKENKPNPDVQGLMDDGLYTQEEATQILNGGLETVIG